MNYHSIFLCLPSSYDCGIYNHRKKAVFDPEGAKTPERILMKHDMVDDVQDLTPMTTLVGIAQRGWSGQTCDLSNSEFVFSLFYRFLSHAPRSHFLATRDDRVRVLG